MKNINICSVSGGKDSTALYCLMTEIHGKDFVAIFADTGHEHPVTINYVKNLHHMAGGPEVIIVKADFSKGLAKKGFDKSGYTFLDLCLWKGRAPSIKAQFCTEHLKLWPIKFYLTNLFSEFNWTMHTGIRAGESARRAKMQPFMMNDFFDCLSVLPMLYMSEEEEFAYLKSKAVPPNPLYALGYGRVGCFPCIHATKNELNLLPDWAWDRLEFYENKIGRTWFAPDTVPGYYIPNIANVRDWCKTTPKVRGRQFDLFRGQITEDTPSCMTGWLACE